MSLSGSLIRYARTNAVPPVSPVISFKEGEEAATNFNINDAILASSTLSETAGEGFLVEASKTELVKALDKCSAVCRAGGATKSPSGEKQEQASSNWVEPKKMVPPLN